MNDPNTCPLSKQPASSEYSQSNSCSLVKCPDCGEFVISDQAAEKLATRGDERKQLSERSFKLPDTHILYIFMNGDQVDSRPVDGDNWQELK